MPNVAVSATYPVLYKNMTPVIRNAGAAALELRRETGSVFVTIDEVERHIAAELRDVSVSDELLAWLPSAGKFINGYPLQLELEILSLANSLEDAARAVLASVKYLLSRPDMPDNALGMASRFTCTTEAGQQLQIPVPIKAFGSGHSLLPLDSLVLAQLQDGLDKGWLPLAGMRHLYRAMQESEPRFRWIDTTIALELCIKEALIRKRPYLETILLNLPSPPLDKLYGTIMKESFGEPSKFLKDIKNGAEVRNKLIHRPTGFAVTREQASAYVTMAHQAIHQLFRLLYPDWLISERMSQMVFHD